MKTEHEKLIATHKAYKNHAQKERVELVKKVEELQKTLKDYHRLTDIDTKATLEELTAKNIILKQLVTVITNSLDDKNYIIALLRERGNG